MSRIAFYGGSFNPPHYSHYFAASWALCSGAVDEVWMVPCASHAFGKELAPFARRVEMCQAGAVVLSAKIKISTIEQTLPPPNYTISTIRALQAKFPEHQFRLLVGADILLEKDKWQDFEQLVELAPLLLIGRDGTTGVAQPALQLPAISSSMIRALIARGEDASDWIPTPVLSILLRHGLYQT